MRKDKGKAKEVVDEGHGEDNAAVEKDCGGAKDSDVKSTQTGPTKKEQDRGNQVKSDYNLRSKSKAVRRMSLPQSRPSSLTGPRQATGQQEVASSTVDAAQAKSDDNNGENLETKEQEKEKSLNEGRNSKDKKVEDPPYWGKVGWYRGYCVRDLQERSFRMQSAMRKPS
ncbi:MAG: hypothetical protein Q9191_000026 [Dirinaria sp. TL-2023a]